MQVANALNNTIRILFNPKVETFKLFDFLIVKSSNDRYLAEIVEIYDDKFDSSQNVAKLRLFYKIAPNNEVMPYDNFTPNKECEIVKVKPDEVESFINQDKDTFIFATNTKTSQGLNVQYDFFNNNAVILADKIENANAVSLNLAKKLSSKKHTVIVDFTGVVEYDDAKKITACKNFKMPLNFSTLDLVFDRCLSDASLEFQAIGQEIINAVKKYAKTQELGFIPFNAFVNVILQQYKATPYPELQLLLARMKKFQMNNIFAKNKKDYETLAKTIEKNDISIVDLSGLDGIWQKAYLEYIVADIDTDIYLITRINDESFDTDLINKIYNSRKNIKFVPNVSYNYSKLPSIMQYCKNYILMPSLNQRNDFLDANFALANLISDGCIIFGENTDNFIYLARDYELEIQEKRKNYRKIALSMAQVEDNKPAEDSISDSQKLVQELSDLEEQSIKEHQEEICKQELSEEPLEEVSEEVNKPVEEDEFQEINEPANASEIPQEIQTIRNIQEVKLSNEPAIAPSEPIVKEISQEVEVSKDDEFVKIEEATQEDKQDVFQPIVEKNTIITTSEAVENIEAEPKIQEEITTPVIEAPQEIIEQPVEVEQNTTEEVQEEPITSQEVQEMPAVSQEIQKEPSITEDTQQEIIRKEKEIDISDEELDFFELSESTAALANEENVVIDDVEYKVKSDNLENNIIETNEDTNEDDDLDLSEIASNAIENNFEDIINSKKDVNKPTFEIDENTTIQVDLNEGKKENLPIFKEEEVKEQKALPEYVTGGIVVHNKYGRGVITKIIQYDQRQLLQIDFEESGKKLLDPKVAEIHMA
ncbi:MAG: hypothetical protein IJ877_00455 [Candidatus Gastranaerophilales bacterium]|nr:hypothetical protein [Candidatus Gastranaerophilales bacterium]